MCSPEDEQAFELVIKWDPQQLLDDSLSSLNYGEDDPECQPLRRKQPPSRFGAPMQAVSCNESRCGDSSKGGKTISHAYQVNITRYAENLRGYHRMSLL